MMSMDAAEAQQQSGIATTDTQQLLLSDAVSTQLEILWLSFLFREIGGTVRTDGHADGGVQRLMQPLGRPRNNVKQQEGVLRSRV